MADHSAFLRGLSRYKAVIGETDYKKACLAIKAAGYATAPDYAQVLIKLIEQYGLTKFDSATAPVPTKPAATTAFKAGDRVRIIKTASLYYPGGPAIPAQYKGQATTVTQADYPKGSGKAVTKGGETCVLLKNVNTWTAIKILEKA